MSAENLKETIQNDMKAAMREKDKQRLGTVRMLLAAIKQKEIDEKITMDDTAVMAVVEKMIKQRRDSLQQYETANREDLAAVERAEIDVLQAYLPEQLSEGELNDLLDQAFAALEVTSMKDMGKLMAHMKTQAAGRADMAVVSKMIKDRLAAL